MSFRVSIDRPWIRENLDVQGSGHYTMFATFLDSRLQGRRRMSAHPSTGMPRVVTAAKHECDVATHRRGQVAHWRRHTRPDCRWPTPADRANSGCCNCHARYHDRPEARLV